MLEITYDTGARVILQGPVTYEVDSAVGGYLAVGKLTTRLGGGAKPHATNPKSEIPNFESSPSTLHSSLFTITTPTAVVTDLGTEFGVEVGKTGLTTSHVFRGTVEVRMMSVYGRPGTEAKVLHANESAFVEEANGVRRLVSGNASRSAIYRVAAPSDFVREIPERVVKTLDLVDVIAGGDGFSGKRDAGIDMLTGRLTSVPPPGGHTFVGDGKYHRAVGVPFVDGVFIPKLGDVQLDSAGHVFPDFLAVSGMTAEHVWACGRIPYPDGMNIPIPTTLGGIDYASEGHGFLFMHANKGVTFDLAAIRKANANCRLTRFASMAGSTAEPADLWVFVDGQVRYRRQQINRTHGGFAIAIPISDVERFLTLVATDGGDGIGGDWVIFGDPRLEMRIDTAVRHDSEESLTAQ